MSNSLFNDVFLEDLDKMIKDLDLAVPVTKRSNHNGMSCTRCNEFNQYAEPNQKDNSYKCYRCRNGL